MSEQLEIVRDILTRNTDFRPLMDLSKISLSSQFREDLGFDSLAMAMLFYELQESYPTLKEQDIQTWKTLEQCCRRLAEVAK